MTKECIRCHEILACEEFPADERCNDGRRNVCRSCRNGQTKEWRKNHPEYDKTVSGLSSHIYRHQKWKSKRRGHPEPTYTKEELQEWLVRQDRFSEIYEHWMKTGKSEDRPSVDRVDHRRPYTMENIQLLTWRENNEKGRKYETMTSPFWKDEKRIVSMLEKGMTHREIVDILGYSSSGSLSRWIKKYMIDQL